MHLRPRELPAVNFTSDQPLLEGLCTQRAAEGERKGDQGVKRDPPSSKTVNGETLRCGGPHGSLAQYHNHLLPLLHDDQKFDELPCLARSLLTATAILRVQIVKITHPSSGTSAVLLTNQETAELGWSAICLPTPRRKLSSSSRYYPPTFVDAYSCHRVVS